jgi:hypothetical protein
MYKMCWFMLLCVDSNCVVDIRAILLCVDSNCVVEIRAMLLCVDSNCVVEIRGMLLCVDSNCVVQMRAMLLCVDSNCVVQIRAMLLCVDSNCFVEIRAMSAQTVHYLKLLVSDRVLCIAVTVSECWISSLLHAHNQTINVMCTVNCTVGRVQEALYYLCKIALNANCVKKTPFSI